MKNSINKTLITALLLGSFHTQAFADDNTPDLANGAQVWADVCMRCHNLRLPSDLSKRAWRFSMKHMRVRAGLTGKETRDIQAFILSTKTANDTQ